MNVAQANSVINALNHIAELVTALAADVEAAAWEGVEDHAGMSGTRPIAAAQLAQPALEAAVAEQDKQVAQQADLTPVVSLEEVRGVLAELSSSGKTAQVRQLILDAGAERLSDGIRPSTCGCWIRRRDLADA